MTPTGSTSEPFDDSVGLDVAAIVRAASTGFGLLIGAEAIALLVGLAGLPPGLVLTMLAATVYAVTGRRAAEGQVRPAVHGALAAVAAYTLTLPLRLMTQAILSPWFVVVGIAFAFAVGGVAGRIQANADAAEDDVTDDPTD